jgi:hypothetical protein
MHLLALLLAAGVTVHIARARRIRPPLAIAMVALVAYWLTLMFGRGWEGEPYASHYVYIGAVLVVLVALELFAGRRVPLPVARALAGLACLAAIANTVVLLHFGGKRREDAGVVRAQVGALELARAAVPARFKVNDDDEQAPSLYAGPYFTGTRRLGSSPAPDVADIAGAPEYARAAADALLVRALRAGPAAGEPAADPAAPRQ